MERVLLIELHSGSRCGSSERENGDSVGVKAVKDLLEDESSWKTGFGVWQECVMLHDLLGIRVNGVFDFSEMSDLQLNEGFEQPGRGGLTIGCGHEWTPGDTSEKDIDHDASEAVRPWEVGLNGWVNGWIHWVQPVNMSRLDSWSLEMCRNVVVTFRRLQNIKEDFLENEISRTERLGVSGFVVENERYKTRIRVDESVEVTMSGKRRFRAVAVGRDGRRTLLQVEGESAELRDVDTVEKIDIDKSTGISREDKNMIQVIRNVLMGSKVSPFVKMLFDGGFGGVESKGDEKSSSDRVRTLTVDPELNHSQEKAFRAILDLRRPAEIVWGPPGTGKTTVIVECIKALVSRGNTKGKIVCTAKSNIAVKNMAEVLLRRGFKDFHIIVSEEYLTGWHEHHYQSAELKSRILLTKDLHTLPCHQCSPVVLCTLAVLSSGLKNCNISRLFVDESSQTSSDVDITSVFSVESIRKRAIFLDTQHRMPKLVADFLSKHFYSNRLRTGSSVTAPQKSTSVAMLWHDIRGKEKPQGTSFVNEAEAFAVCKLVHQYGIPSSQLAILTPYDTQRNRIVKKLKQRMPLHGAYERVFCVDSFQGQEAPVVIISPTRTKGVGFMADERRIWNDRDGDQGNKRAAAGGKEFLPCIVHVLFRVDMPTLKSNDSMHLGKAIYDTLRQIEPSPSEQPPQTANDILMKLRQEEESRSYEGLGPALALFPHDTIRTISSAFRPTTSVKELIRHLRELYLSARWPSPAHSSLVIKAEDLNEHLFPTDIREFLITFSGGFKPDAKEFYGLDQFLQLEDLEGVFEDVIWDAVEDSAGRLGSTREFDPLLEFGCSGTRVANFLPPLTPDYTFSYDQVQKILMVRGFYDHIHKILNEAGVDVKIELGEYEKDTMGSGFAWFDPVLYTNIMDVWTLPVEDNDSWGDAGGDDSNEESEDEELTIMLVDV
ncbi:hypothetical protein HK102_006994 [Quaeritorhiza haematococci]|nr:hypothetical protein HK102_006994 [Quaeritorhiza haematococci]